MFCVYGTWDPLDGCKILPWDVGTNFPTSRLIFEKCVFCEICSVYTCNLVWTRVLQKDHICKRIKAGHRWGKWLTKAGQCKLSRKVWCKTPGKCNKLSPLSWTRLQTIWHLYAHVSLTSRAGDDTFQVLSVAEQWFINSFLPSSQTWFLAVPRAGLTL